MSGQRGKGVDHAARVWASSEQPLGFEAHQWVMACRIVLT